MQRMKTRATLAITHRVIDATTATKTTSLGKCSSLVYICNTKWFQIHLQWTDCNHQGCDSFNCAMYRHTVAVMAAAAGGAALSRTLRRKRRLHGEPLAAGLLELPMQYDSAYFAGRSTSFDSTPAVMMHSTAVLYQVGHTQHAMIMYCFCELQPC